LSRITGVTEPSYALANQLRSGLRLPNHDNLDRLLGRTGLWALTSAEIGSILREMRHCAGR
jgi:hypothetical protein